MLDVVYVPSFNAMNDPHVEQFLEEHPAAQLVTVGADGVPDATLLPILRDGDHVLAHLARSNEHWLRIVDSSQALLVVTGADAYVSPSWYATKAEHGRVVPTWNYSAVHIRGRISVHDDSDWVRGLVTRLTEQHESHRTAPWAVADAPEKFVRGQLKAIVGVEIAVESIEGKAKLSQNRSDADRLGAIDGLLAEPGGSPREVAAAMRAVFDS